MPSPTRRNGFFAATSGLILSARGQSQNGCCVTLTYPVGGETFNNIDTVIVDYSTNYPNTNLTLWCNNPGTYETWNVDSSGTFTFSHFTNDVTIDSYPATCHLGFLNVEDTSNSYQSPDFTLTDVSGVSVQTYSTAPPGSTPTQLITSSGVTITASSQPTSLSFTPVTSTRTSVSTANDVASTGASGTGSVAAASSSAAAHGSSSGLSTGAKAGIGVAAALIALAIVAGIIYLLAMKRRLRRAEAEAVAAKEPPTYQGNGGINSHGAPSVSSMGNNNTSSWAPAPVPFQQQGPAMAEAYGNDKQSLAPTMTNNPTSPYPLSHSNSYGNSPSPSEPMKSPGGYSMTHSNVSAYGGTNSDVGGYGPGGGAVPAAGGGGMKPTMGYTSGPGYDAPVELGNNEISHGGRGHHELA